MGVVDGHHDGAIVLQDPQQLHQGSAHGEGIEARPCLRPQRGKRVGEGRGQAGQELAYHAIGQGRLGLVAARPQDTHVIPAAEESPEQGALPHASRPMDQDHSRTRVPHVCERGFEDRQLPHPAEEVVVHRAAKLAHQRVAGKKPLVRASSSFAGVGVVDAVQARQTKRPQLNNALLPGPPLTKRGRQPGPDQTVIATLRLAAALGVQGRWEAQQRTATGRERPLLLSLEAPMN